MTDKELFDTLDVPEDRRLELANMLHAWSAAYLPGPNLYAVMATIYWNVLKGQPVIDIPEDTFDPAEWLGTIRGTPWVNHD